MGVFPLSIERIIAENRITDAVFRRSWSWKNYIMQYLYIVAIIALVITYDYNRQILSVPLWVYGLVSVVFIAVRIAFNITANKDATEIEDGIIKGILHENEAENQVYCRDEIKERLLLESHIRHFRTKLNEIESW
ncbi:MAG: hypothetical protein FWF87_04295 [Synergistaceae bacterium]|nr:hypothetical protein [Synergistaceae bacterium]